MDVFANFQLTRDRIYAAEKVFLLFIVLFFSQKVFTQITLVKEITGGISPKSVVSNDAGLFAAQNMMYKHTITFYNAKGDLVSTVKDDIDLNGMGFEKYKGETYQGGPVEACFTKDKKYLWVSNYAMIGKGFDKEGCDGCSGKDYDPGFLYKINTQNYKIENAIEVGAVPKFISISDNGRLLIVSNWTSSDISIINLDNDNEIKRVDVGSRPRGIAIDKNNQIAYVAIMGSDKIARVNLLNYSVSYIKGVGKAPRHLIIDRLNRFLYVAVNSSNHLVKIDLFTGKRVYCKVKSGPRTMAISKNERWIYVVNYYADTFQKIDVKTFKVVETVQTKHHPIGITLNSETNEIWVACYVGVIQIFKDGQKNSTIKKDNKPKTLSESRIQKKIKSDSRIASQILIPNTTEQKELGRIVQKPMTENGHRYFVIVGSFSTLANAEIYANTLKKQGYHPEILKSGKSGMLMVSVESHTSKEAAVAASSRLGKKLNVADAWVHQKQIAG